MRRAPACRARSAMKSLPATTIVAARITASILPDIRCRISAIGVLLVAQEPGVIEVDDNGQAAGEERLDCGGDPRQGLLLEPDQIITAAAQQRSQPARIGAGIVRNADRRAAVKRADMGIVEQRIDIEFKALPLERWKKLQEAHAAAGAEPFITGEQQNFGHRHRSGAHAACLILRTSGGIASSASAFSAASSGITCCCSLPRRRIETMRSAASLRPTTSSTGTLASECSRTL